MIRRTDHGAAAEEEAAHVLDQAIDEALGEGPEGLAGGGLDVVALRAREDRVELHEVAPAEAALGLRAEDEAAVEEHERLVAEHPGDQALVLGAVDPAEVGEPGEVGPGLLGRDPAGGERHRQELMDEHRPAAVAELDGLDPAGAGELDEGDRLGDALGGLAEEGRVGDLPGAAPGPAHALEERGDGVGRLVLEDAVEVADVDPELERGGADDAGVAAVMKALLGEGALLERDRAVVDEDGGAGPPHVLGDGLGDRARLTEEEALAALGDLARVAGEVVEVEGGGRRGAGGGRAAWAGRRSSPGGSRCPAASRGSRRGCRRSRSGRRAGRRGESRARRSMTLRRWSAAIAAGEGVDLVDDDDPEVAEERAGVDLLRDQHHLERLGVVIRSSVGSRRKVRRSWLVVSPCQTKRRRPTISV